MKQEADIIVINGDVWPLDDNNKKAEAIVIYKDSIVYVGDDDSALKYKGEGSVIINADGNTVLPGLIDTHTHLIKLGFSLIQLDLRDVDSIGTIKKMVEKKVEELGKGKWIIGRAWDQEKFKEGRWPNKFDLDEVAPDNPVFLIRVCGHVGLANSLALKLAKIDRNTSDPEGGLIDRYEDGEPTGILKEGALSLVYDAIPKPKDEDMIEAAKRAMEEAIKFGVTTVHLVSATPEEVKILKKLKDKGELKIRLRIYYDYRFLENLISLGLYGRFGDDILRINGIKIMVDGSLGGRTAALREPYNDDPNNTGKIVIDKDILDRVVLDANRFGYQLAIHGIGDKAIEYILDSVEKALYKYPVKDHRHRVEHASIMSPDLINKMSGLKMLASVHPRFIISDFWVVDRVGEERAKWTYNFKTLIKYGIILGGGSDTPVDPINPFYGIYSAVTRGYYQDISLYKYTKDENLSIEEAVKLYTVNASILGFDEGVIGSIKQGHKADIIILSKKLSEIDPSEIKDIEVNTVIVNGKIIYQG